MKKLIIFDIDGTLLHSNWADSKYFAQAFNASFGFELPSLDWSSYPHCMDTSILEALFDYKKLPQPSEEKIQRFQDDYVALLEKGRLENPEEFLEVGGARKIVERLVADERYVVGIGTGGYRKPASVKLRHVGIDTSQLHMAFADGNISREDMVNEALRKAHAAHDNISRVVYIGDAIWDVQTTRNLGIPFIGIRHREDSHVLHEAGAKDVISDYLDQEGFIRLLEEAVVPGGLS